MKKLTKLFGLLLVAGALLTGCQQNVDIDTDELKLSNGKWEMNLKNTESFEGTEGGVSFKSSGTEKEKDTFKVSGDAIEYLSASGSGSGKIEFPADTDATILEFAKEMIAAGLPDGVELKLDGTTFSYSYTYTATEDDLKAKNDSNPKVSEIKFPKVARIQTNKKKTEYKISWETESTDSTDPANPTTEKESYNITFKKLK